MRNIGLILLALLLISGCAVPNGSLQSARQGETAGEGQLLDIRILRWDTTVFSGLLLWRWDGDDISYVLLDAIGLKLIEARVTNEDSYRLVGGGGVMKSSQLVPFLSTAMARMYLVQPATEPCSSQGILQLCRETRDDGYSQQAKLGPLPYWRVEESGGADGTGRRMEYHQPWLGMQIVVEGKKR